MQRWYALTLARAGPILPDGGLLSKRNPQASLRSLREEREAQSAAAFDLSAQLDSERAGRAAEAEALAAEAAQWQQRAQLLERQLQAAQAAQAAQPPAAHAARSPADSDDRPSTAADAAVAAAASSHLAERLAEAEARAGELQARLKAAEGQAAQRQAQLSEARQELSALRQSSATEAGRLQVRLCQEALRRVRHWVAWLTPDWHYCTNACTKRWQRSIGLPPRFPTLQSS